MTLNIDFTPQEEAWLTAQAARRGLLPDEVVRRLIDEQLLERSKREEPTEEAALLADPKAAASIALLKSWLDEDATDDPEEIRQAQAELDEFKRNMNQPRKEAGSRLLYPEVE